MVALILWLTLGPRFGAGELLVEFAIAFAVYGSTRGRVLTRFIRSG
jgi:hypothetical protein